MNKRTLFLVLIFLSLFAFSFSIFAEKGNSESANYPPEPWITDIKEAYNIAQQEDKQILINFTGSDWCVWCNRLKDEVFSTKEFKAYADENLVLLFLDFPRELKLSSEQQRHNQIIAQTLGIQGYPSIWLFEKDLSPLLATGYREGGAKEYIRHLKDDRPDISKKDSDKFRTEFKKIIVENFGSF